MKTLRIAVSSVTAAFLAVSACQHPMPPGPPSTPPAATASSARNVDPPPIVNPPIPRDLQALLATPRRRHCAPHEVAPGVWVRFHCGAFDAVANARQADPAKLRMLKHGHLRLDSAVGAAQLYADGGMTEETTWTTARRARRDP
jgi:hypothetical protein